MVRSAAQKKRDNKAQNLKRQLAAAEAKVVPTLSDIENELRLLANRTKGNPTDADADIDFAYRHMAVPNVTPKMAPSTSAWEWYLFARNDRDEFLKICAKREDAKAKMAGTITNQRMLDDQRQQFEVLGRIGASLKKDVTSIVGELADRFPDDLIEVLTKRGWKVETGSKENT